MAPTYEEIDINARQAALLDMTAAFCRDHLDEFYEGLCHRFIHKMASMERIDFAFGPLENIAPGIIYALGAANFLFDRQTKPYISGKKIAEYFGAKHATVVQRAGGFRQMMDWGYFGPEYVLPFLRPEVEAGAATLPVARVKAEPGEFFDGEHAVAHDFRLLMDEVVQEGWYPDYEKRFRHLIFRDPFFFDSYTGFSHVMSDHGSHKVADAILAEGHRRAKLRLSGVAGGWPRKLEWGWIENRHLIRLFNAWARHSWENGDIDEALDAWRRLLGSDPRDAMGVRFSILAIRTNMSPGDFDEMENSEYPVALGLWFDKYAPTYPHEFSGWFEAEEAAEGETY